MLRSPQCTRAHVRVEAAPQPLRPTSPSATRLTPALPDPAHPPSHTQCFGEKGESDIKLTEADVLSAVRFDDSGDYLATGDRGGRIVVFERAGGGKHRRRAAALSVASDGTNSSASDSIGHAGDPQSRPPPALTGPGSSEYRFYTEFQSHEAEFDYLKSLEIEEKINQIAWCRRSGPSLMLLSTNEKTIKLWKVRQSGGCTQVCLAGGHTACRGPYLEENHNTQHASSRHPPRVRPLDTHHPIAPVQIQEKKLRSVANFNVTTGPYGGHSPVNALRVPTLSAAGETAVTTTPRRVYATAHAYHINSIAVNSDGQTFLSSDDLRVHLWHLDNPTLSFNVVDIKPSTLEELTEVITGAFLTARFPHRHPTGPHLISIPRCGPGLIPRSARDSGANFHADATATLGSLLAVPPTLPRGLNRRAATLARAGERQAAAPLHVASAALSRTAHCPCRRASACSAAPLLGPRLEPGGGAVRYGRWAGRRLRDAATSLPSVTSRQTTIDHVTPQFVTRCRGSRTQLFHPFSR